jgi:quinolinate synthase
MIQRIKELRKHKDALILAHLYQLPEVQDIADIVGDSLELAKAARSASAGIIVFCGVYFMAETAKILNPDKTVLMPEPDAGCPMADMIGREDVLALREKHPGAAVVCYVNSSAQVKAESDICCTSSNALKVAASVENDEIIFIPDKNLGRYVASQLPEKRFIFYDGFCPTHNKITVSAIQNARAVQKNAKVLVHPECTPDVIASADFVGSTSQIIDYVRKSPARDFIIGTESGIFHQLQKLCPEKRFFSPHGGMLCPNMKKTTLEKVLLSLENGQYKIEVDGKTARAAYGAIDRMLALK